MSTQRSTFTERVRLEVVPSRAGRRALGVLVFTVATALSAKLSLPLPGTPVPFTFQPLLVLLSGVLLGGRLGALSQVLYLAAGASGLPVFVMGGGLAYLLGPTGGYLMAYPFAAFLAGSLAGEGWGRNGIALLAGLASIDAGGLAWLAATGPFDLAVALGVQPFLLADLVKVGIALVVAARMRERALELFAR